MKAFFRNKLVWLAVWLVYIGFLGPFLISAKSTEAVIGGIALAVAILYWGWVVLVDHTPTTLDNNSKE